MDRKGYIGGSDIAAVLGMSKWKTALQLWAEKTGEIEPEDISGVEAVELGTELEDFVAKKFTRKTGLAVRQAPMHYHHKVYDYMRCQVDRLVTGTNDLLECKTTSAWRVKDWEGEEIPADYICQVIWQLGITGRDVGYIAVLIGGQKFVWKKIIFDLHLFEKMVEEAINFWKCVQDKTPPMAVGDDNPFMVTLYPEHGEGVKEADESLNESIALLQETKHHISEMEKTKDEIEAKVKQIIGESLGIKTSKYLITWKEQQTTKIDTEKMKEAGIYDAYKKVGATRVLRIKLGEK